MVVVVHAAVTWFLVGLIWTIQRVHYPLFDQVGREGFVAYSRRHVRAITPLVAPAMLIEATCALLLVRPSSEPAALEWAGLALLLVIWLVTATLSVPRHLWLERGWDEAAWRGLVATNWIRTVAWSARGVLALLLLQRF